MNRLTNLAKITLTIAVTVLANIAVREMGSWWESIGADRLHTIILAFTKNIK